MEENYFLPYRIYMERLYIYLTNLIFGGDVRNKLYFAKVLFLKTQLTSAALHLGEKKIYSCVLMKMPGFLTENSMGTAKRDRLLPSSKETLEMSTSQFIQIFSTFI